MKKSQEFTVYAELRRSMSKRAENSPSYVLELGANRLFEKVVFLLLFCWYVLSLYTVYAVFLVRPNDIENASTIDAKFIERRDVVYSVRSPALEKLIFFLNRAFYKN